MDKNKINRTKTKKLMVPIEIFRKRNLGALESLVEYLRDEHHLRFSQIARILERHYNTIRTSYVKAKKKKGGNKDGIH